MNVRRTVDGTVAVSGRFDREAGEVVLATVEKLASRSSDGDGRPAARRRADALATLCRAAAGRLMTASVWRERVTDHAFGDLSLTGMGGSAGAARDKPVRPAGRRRLKSRVKRRARR